MSENNYQIAKLNHHQIIQKSLRMNSVGSFIFNPLIFLIQFFLISENNKFPIKLKKP